MTQIVVEPNTTAIHDVVVPMTRRISSWNGYARSVRGSKWRGLAKTPTENEFALSVGKSKLLVRGFGPSRRNAETEEIAWRWALENVAAADGAELLVRFVVKLGRRSSSA